jgi:hypothetical protein
VGSRPRGRAFDTFRTSQARYRVQIARDVLTGNVDQLASDGAILSGDAEAAAKLPPPAGASEYLAAMRGYAHAYGNISSFAGDPAGLGKITGELNQANADLGLVTMSGG